MDKAGKKGLGFRYGFLIGKSIIELVYCGSFPSLVPGRKLDDQSVVRAFFYCGGFDV